MTADYPDALWMPADATNYRVANRAGVSLIVIHITDGHGDPKGVAEMWQTRYHGSSAHFVVGQDGTVIQSVPIAHVAWHAHAANSLSVGIEHCCRSPGEWSPSDTGLPPSLALYNASARLVAWLCVKLGITPSRVTIMGHNEADRATTHADCPTGAWDWSVYMPLVMAAYQAVQLVA